MSGLMNTSQSTNNSSQAPPGQLTSTAIQNYQNHLHQFQPIQHQPLVSSNAKTFDAGKINSTATHIELEQQSNCDISSLLTMSCRGRAEAFARSLQSRLRTLGSQDQDDGTDDAVDGASTWVNNNNNNATSISAITDLQPRIASDAADSYFDFDLEPESPGSPIDECEYTRLIETSGSTPQEPQAPESGFVCASPCSTLENESRGSASSSDVQFFDPESSDTGTEFYDCPPIEHHPVPKPPRRVYHHLSHNKIAIRPPSPTIIQSTMSTTKMNGHVRLVESGDSSESLPPSQSTSSNLNCDESSISTANSNSNSTLQDADGEMPLNDEIAPDLPDIQQASIDECHENGEANELEKSTLHHFDSSRTIFIKYNEEEDEEEENVENNNENNSEEQVEFNQDDVLNEITTKSDTIQFEPPDVETETKETPIEVVKEDVEQTRRRKDSDEESEYERPPRVRRCSSLKTGKTPPGTPGRKKIVRFADVLGLDLADVRTFLDEVPKIPKSAYEDLDITLTSQSVQLGPRLEKVLVPLFQQPGCLPNFLDRLRDGQVCLESAAITDPINLTITGCVRVRNLDFHKSVHIRYSLDSWRSYSDLTASYVENSCDGFSDKFSFIMFGNSMQIGQRVEIAIRFQVKGEQYWDSNYGTNYAFQCLPCSAHNASPIIESDSSVSSDGNVSAAVPEVTEVSESTEDVASHVDSLGHQQWSNTFLY